ncbi:MAG: CotH kinase family protein [Defluviitaleaceae bacterium]|nr:CotH kinase family protein [Defluviitaleaceae bacterium]
MRKTIIRTFVCFFAVVLMATACIFFFRGETVPHDPSADTPVETDGITPSPIRDPVSEPAIPHSPLPVNPFHFQSLFLTTYRCPFDIERTLWHDAYLTLTGAFEGESVRLRGRGNTTWWLSADKRPLRLRFSEPIYLLDSGYAARDWILLSNHFDYTLLRNYAALTLSALLGQGGRMDYLPTSRHVHLYINGEYEGVYQLTDERDVHPRRVDITRHTDPARSDYFLELNARADRDGVYDETYFSVYNRLYDIRFPSGNLRTADHTAYARDYIGRVSEAIRMRRWEDILSLADLDSLVDFYIVQELFKNPDAHENSVFMTIRGEGSDRRLYMGPTWDFDLAAGNRASQYSPHYLYVGIANYWYRNLMDMPQFLTAVTERWNRIKDVEITQMIRLVYDTATYYRADFERNFTRHPVLGTAFWNTPPQMAEIDTFMGQVYYLVDWLNKRVAWLDDFFNERTDHVPLLHLMEQRANTNPLVIYHQGQPMDAMLFQLHGVVMAELYGIAVAFGLKVEYDPQTQIIEIVRDGIKVTHELFGTEYLTQNKNGLHKSRFEASSFRINDYIFVPVEPILAVYGITAAINPG